MSEDQLWNAVVKGDDGKFRELFDLFYPVLCVYAKQYVENNEDIVQNVFVSLWESRHKIIIGTSIRNYLVVSVRNQCFDYLRRNERMKQYMDYQNINNLNQTSNNEEVLLLSELQDLLAKALAQLPESYRIVFEMHRMEGKDYAEIADKLGISIRTAKRYNAATTELLKKNLRDYLPLLLLYSPFLKC
jgi:RNA polymerase sigma-70 factor (family 1)